MKSISIQKNTFLFLLGGIVIVSASLVYLFTGGIAVVTPTPKVLSTPLADLPCRSFCTRPLLPLRR